MARNWQSGGPDDHGRPAEKFISDGDGLPCRHCLQHIAAGETVLVGSYKPFTTTQPYAEQGPVFLHARTCDPYTDTASLPAMYAPDGQLLLRGYDRHDRIVYGTGRITANRDVAHAARAIFDHPRVAYIHARSASNNCYQFRMDIAGNATDRSHIAPKAK
jgi:hypothetical protein